MSTTAFERPRNSTTSATMTGSCLRPSVACPEPSPGSATTPLDPLDEHPDREQPEPDEQRQHRRHQHHEHEALADLAGQRELAAHDEGLGAEPHHAGSPYEIKLADYVADQFKAFGLTVSRYDYSVLIPWPGERRIEIVAPDRMTLQVEEETIPGDPWAAKPGRPAPWLNGQIVV